MARTGNTYENWLRGDNLINIQGLWFLGSALPLIAIYLYTKFYLNTTRSFKVICWTKLPDGPFGEHKNIMYWYIKSL